MSRIVLEEQTTADTPSADKVVIYPKAGGDLYTKDDAGEETCLKGMVSPPTTGMLENKASEATIDITAAATCTIQVNVPTGSRLLGVQLRVDSILAEKWDAEWNDGALLETICTNQAVAKNTKVNKFYEQAAVSRITDAETDIVISPTVGGSFTAQGTIRAIAYYQAFVTLADA